MNTATKIGLGVVALAVAGTVALRFGGSKAAKTGLDQVLANLPPGWTATHGPVTYNALSGEAQVDDLVITHNGEKFLAAANLFASGIEGVSATSWPKQIDKIVIKDLTGDTYRHVAHIEVDGLQLANVVSLFDAGAYPDGKPASAAMMKLLTSVDASDALIHVQVPPRPTSAKGLNISAVDVHIGHFHNDGVSARQFLRPPDNDSLKDWAFIADAARAVSEDGASSKDVTETIPGVGTASIGSASGAAIRDGKIGELDERDIAFIADGKPDRFRLDRIEAKDVDLNKLLDSLPQLSKPDSKGKLNTNVKVGEFDLDGLSADFEHAPLVTMDSLEGQTHYGDDGRQDGTLTMRALKIATTGRETKPQVKLALDRFGMADFTIDLDEAATYASADGHLKLSKADVDFHDLGTLHLALDATGLENLPTAGTDQVAAMQAVTLIGGTVQWNDNSLTNRIFKVISAQSGKSIDDLHAALALPVASLAMFLPNQPDAPAQVNAFLADPKQLTITLAPSPPVSLYDVAKASAQQKAALLGVTVKGN